MNNLESNSYRLHDLDVLRILWNTMKRLAKLIAKMLMKMAAVTHTITTVDKLTV